MSVKTQYFNSFFEWNRFNKEITGISLLRTNSSIVSKRHILLIFTPYSINNNTINKKPLVSIHKVKFMQKEKVFYADNGNTKGRRWANNLLLVRKKMLPEIKNIISNFVNYYAKYMEQKHILEKQKKEWLVEQIKRIRQEANERFNTKIEMPEVSIEELFKQKPDELYYFCTKCDEYYSFDKYRATCPICKNKLKSLIDSKVDIDVLLENKLLKEYKEKK